MRSRYRNTNITKSIFAASRIESGRGERVRCCSRYSLLLCIINSKLTMLTSEVNAPPPD